MHDEITDDLREVHVTGSHLQDGPRFPADSATAAATELARIPGRFGYSPMTDTVTPSGLDPEVARVQYACHDRLQEVLALPSADVALVTGFGPTNPPSLATLSIVLKARDWSRILSCRTDVVVSDLGAWNSRNLIWAKLSKTTAQYLSFLRRAGFMGENVMVRSHRDLAMLETAAVISRFLKDEDFLEDREATDQLYDAMGLRSHLRAVLQDALYTVADILLPLFEGKRQTLVVAGLEEHYFVRLARKCLQRLHAQCPGQFLPLGSGVSGLYGALVPGLPPYPKMSKSIPPSGIFLDSQDSIRNAMASASPQLLARFVTHCSGWEHKAIRERLKQPLTENDLEDVRGQFIRTLDEFAAAWNSSSPTEEMRYGPG